MATTAQKARFGRTVNLFAVVSIVIFFAVVILAAATFFYRGALIRDITALDIELSKAKKSFEPEFVDTATRLHKRIQSVKTLLGSHRAVSPLFDILEKKTLEQVRFQDLSLSTTGGEILLSMTGEAKSFNSVALQSDVFGGESYFKNPIFSNFNLNERGDVIFNFETTIDPELMRYREIVLRAAASSGIGDESGGFDSSE